ARSATAASGQGFQCPCADEAAKAERLVRSPPQPQSRGGSRKRGCWCRSRPERARAAANLRRRWSSGAAWVRETSWRWRQAKDSSQVIQAGVVLFKARVSSPGFQVLDVVGIQNAKSRGARRSKPDP